MKRKFSSVTVLIVLALLAVMVFPLASTAATALRGSISAWVYNSNNQCNVPAPNQDFVAVAAGGEHSLGLKSNGTVVAWGLNDKGQCNVPAPNQDFVAIAAGYSHSLGLKSNGTVVAWGSNGNNQCNVPAPNQDFVAVAGGEFHSLALKSNGAVVAWGSNGNGQCNVPAPNQDFVAIAGGGFHSLGLKSNGTVVAWGDNSQNQCNVPAPNQDFVAVAGGEWHSLGLKSNGTVVAWGRNSEDQCNVPAPNQDFVAVAAGYFHSLGLKSNGTVVAWGWNDKSQCNVPAPNQDFVAVAGGYYHCLALKEQPPSITSISPELGPPGTTVTVSGYNFRDSQGSSTVTFNGMQASVNLWQNSQIVCTVPDGASTGPVVITTSAGGSNADKIFTVVCPSWYLAEGSTDWGFDTYISIENPNNTPVTVAVTYQTRSGPVTRPDIGLPALSQTTLNPRADLGASDFSTTVVCKENKTIAVDRTMTWTGQGEASPEAHNSVGVTLPGTTWYLPEGSSAWGFECWLLIQNPGSTEANCNFTYMIEGEGPRIISHKIPAGTRKTYSMKDDIGEKDASVKVESNVSVIPERAMYRNNRREGHDSIGTASSATDYYLAEGTTAWGFTTYVLVQNPNGAPTDITITFMTPTGPVVLPAFQMPANSRKTIRVNDIPEVSNTDLSIRVHGSQPIIAERAMYWKGGPDSAEACHDSIGMPNAHTTFYLPDGQSSDGRETWTLVQNPNDSDVTVEMTYMTPSGDGNVTWEETIGASSRRTFNMADKKSTGRAAVMVTSKTAGKKIMVERAMYWNSRGAGTDTIGGYAD